MICDLRYMDFTEVLLLVGDWYGLFWMCFLVCFVVWAEADVLCLF